MSDDIDPKENTKRLMLLILSILTMLVCIGTGGWALKRTGDLEKGQEVENGNLEELDGKIQAQRTKNKSIEDAFLSYSEPVGWRLKPLSSLDRLSSHGIDHEQVKASMDAWLEILKTRYKDEVPPEVLAKPKWSDDVTTNALTVRDLFGILHTVAARLEGAAVDFTSQTDAKRAEGTNALASARTDAAAKLADLTAPIDRIKNAQKILVDKQKEYWLILVGLDAVLSQAETDLVADKAKVEREREGLMKKKIALQKRFQEQKEEVDRAREQQEEDGEILHVDLAQKTCIVNLTRRDKVFRGTRFRVYGVEAGGKRVDKGEIEITRVDEEFTHAAITREPDAAADPKGKINALKAGDRFYNELFSRGIVRTVSFAGRMQGKFSREDLASRAREWGDNAEERVSSKTDLLVVGADYANDANYAEAQRLNVRVMTEKYFYDYLGLEY